MIQNNIKYKIIADFPNNPFKIGDVIWNCNFSNDPKKVTNDGLHIFNLTDKLDEMPHLFEKLITN